MTFYLEKELKKCGHFCYPSTTPDCCSCMDLRPQLDGDLYPIYVDGKGWSDEGTRNHGYCPVCNPKNYDVWVERLRLQREQKLEREKSEEESRQLSSKNALKDKLRAAAQACDRSSVFKYCNGDAYEGEFEDGERDGWGRMTYCDGSQYEGQWKRGLYSGQGTKNWCDGIEYRGEWKDGKMHGMGVYTMMDGTVIDGLFEEDEFAGYAS